MSFADQLPFWPWINGVINYDQPLLGDVNGDAPNELAIWQSASTMMDATTSSFGARKMAKGMRSIEMAKTSSTVLAGDCARIFPWSATSTVTAKPTLSHFVPRMGAGTHGRAMARYR